jgi:hypothetical protein
MESLPIVYFPIRGSLSVPQKRTSDEEANDGIVVYRVFPHPGFSVNTIEENLG